jgi:two-component system response regulator WspF
MRIGIVNQSAEVREAILQVVAEASDHAVAWVVGDGADAVEHARIDRPDLILMELGMPGMDGVEAIRHIMGESPCAILVVTSSVAGNLSQVYQAMGHGALDAVDAPALGWDGNVAGGAVLMYKIDIIHRLLGKPVERPSTVSEAPARSKVVAGAGTAGVKPPQSLIVVGASTGGPQALAEVLTGIPANLNATVIIVQHVDAAFAPGLGQWLSEKAGRRVTMIENGMRPEPRQVLLSSTDDHLILGEEGELRYSREPRSVSYRPSVDVFFSSVARSWRRPGVAVLLTGMGRDGAQGLLELKDRGWCTIAQDEPSSVVWGMPKAAAEIGAAQEILPLERIAAAIARRVPL